MADFIRQVNLILYSPLVLSIQILSGIVSLALFIFWIKLTKETGVWAWKIREVRDAWSQTPLRKGKILTKWQDVQKRMATNDESEWKLAIIEADSILDEVIKQLGYRGNTMGERMKNIKPGQFPHLDDAWRVHKVRNFIAHDASYKLQHATAQHAMEIYRKIFSEFNVVS